ncbi:kinase-like protein, partial [Dendrothele bispora CBS 962.96]
LYDYPDVSSTLRSKILSVMIHLSRKSNLYPNCLMLDNVTKIGDHPAAAGGFGEVWKGSIGGQTACLKVVKIYDDSDVKKLLKEFVKEAILWRQLDHPNVLPFLGLYFLDTTKQRVCLISPWMNNGNLRQFLRDSADSSIDRSRVVVYDIACGLRYLHEKKIVHGDLKGENILITLTGRAVVADFGLSRKVSESSITRFSSLSTNGYAKGSTRWLAPECLLDGGNSTYSSDIYAFACVCYETFTGFVPFYEFPQDISVVFQLSAGRRPARPLDKSDLSDSMWEIMQECWSQEPSMRPTASILPNKVARAACRTFESAEIWDNLLSSQLQKNIRHNDVCPKGSPLETFLFKTQSELLTAGPFPCIFFCIFSS